jgi:hypothetical protein
LGLEKEESIEELKVGPDSQVRFTEGGECRQCHHRIRPDMVRLQMKMIQELPQEVARRQCEAAPKMLEEDDHLTWLWRWHSFTLGREAPH